MVRPLRIEYPGAWYHVMNRGASRQKIFHNFNDFQLFLDLLSETSVRYQIQIHTYCLMSNHYHLLIHTPYANLGKAMRHLDGLYTVRHNRSFGKDGPLFRGRYKAILIEADNYLLHLSRYIHLNPVEAKIVDIGGRVQTSDKSLTLSLVWTRPRYSKLI
jgi:putative transposase